MRTAEEKVENLRTVGILNGIPDDALTEIALLLEEVEVEAGTTIINKGDIGTCMYIVVSGCVRVHDGPRVLDRASAGEVFGEMALLDAAPRSASVTAIEDTRLYRLDQQPFYEMVGKRAEVTWGIIRVLSARLRARLRDMSSLYDSKEEAERELEIGRQIQADFLPDAIPQPQGWEIGAYFQPARQVAGDFYDAFYLANRAMVALVVGDVSGKGVGAALFMSLVRSLLRAYTVQRLSPGILESAGQGNGKAHDALSAGVLEIVRDTNDYVATVHRRAHMFATLFFGVLELESGRLTYISGGHEPAAVITQQQEIRARLRPTGPAVGLFAGLPFRVDSIRLEPGESLLVYTDGVTDAHDPEGAHFGEGRLLSVLAKPVESADALLVSLEAELTAHAGEARQFDDITLLALRRAG